MSSNNTTGKKGSDFGSLAMLAFAIWAVVSIVRGAADAAADTDGGKAIAVVAVAVVGWLLFGRTSVPAGHPPAHFAQRRPELTGFWRVLSGSITEVDDVMVDLGLFRRADDGSIVRPTRLEPYKGTHADWVRFTPLPGTAKAWLRAEEELTFLFKQPLFLSSEVAGTFDMGYWHTTSPEPLPPIDHTQESIWWDDVPHPEIGGSES